MLKAKICLWDFFYFHFCFCFFFFFLLPPISKHRVISTNRYQTDQGFWTCYFWFASYFKSVMWIPKSGVILMELRLLWSHMVPPVLLGLESYSLYETVKSHNLSTKSTHGKCCLMSWEGVGFCLVVQKPGADALLTALANCHLLPPNLFETHWNSGLVRPDWGLGISL